MKNLWSGINPFTSRSISPSLLIVYILLIIYFYAFNPLFLTFKNFQALSTREPIIGIVALGVGIVLISGNLDMSVGAIVGVVAVSVGRLVVNTQLPVILIIFIGIALGTAIGAINGFIVSYIGVNSVIATLGMWALLRGLALTIARGTIYFRNEAFQQIGRGYIFNIIPNVLFFMILFLIIMYCVLRFTKFGRNIYLVGSNSISARFVGLNVRRFKFLPYLFSGSFAAFASILYTSQAGTAFARFGTSFGNGLGWEFRVLVICIVGGLSISGGKGTYIGLFLALLIFGSLKNGFTLINLPFVYHVLFESALLLLALMLDSKRDRKMELLT